MKRGCSENLKICILSEFQETEIKAFHEIVRCAFNRQPLAARVSQILLSQLECPVCMEYMRPAITLCVNGHNICNICKPKAPHCPTCRQQFLNTKSVALEKLALRVKCPCTYRKYGCREVNYAFWLADTKANVSTLHRLIRHLNRILEFALGQVVREVWRHTWRRHTWTYVSICLVVFHLSPAVSWLLQSAAKSYWLSITCFTSSVRSNMG
jgi:hypothetical protein